MKKLKLWCVVVAAGLATGGYRVACGEAPVGSMIVGDGMAAQDEAANDAPSPTPLVINRTGPEPPPAIGPFDVEQARKHQEAWAKHRGVPVEWTNSIGMQCTLIPAGEFLMGSPDSDIDAYSDEKPQRQVRITQPFYLSVCEVTLEQHERVMGKSPSYFEGQLLPVEQVSWHDAVEFCAKLSALPEEQAAGRTYRLPTEAEWEYACRAGTTTAYCFGDDESGLGDYAWYRQNSDERTHPLGQRRPNAWGLYDMHGNVWEWCADWYGEYPAGKVTDPQGPSEGVRRVYRGGSWFNPASLCLSADRGRFQPVVRSSSLGFRVAAVPTGQ